MLLVGGAIAVGSAVVAAAAIVSGINRELLPDAPAAVTVATPIRINRAPVLTLWAAVVAERLGYPEETALSRS